ncbi:MAG: hypothetical protein J0I20_21440 [Chloroflexi bacterium]|nr:hypothetical protein [Chloroflexota bacterium]
MSNPIQMTPVTRQPRQVKFIGWWQALLFMVAGGVLTIGLAILYLVLFVGSPQNNTPLTLPPVSGKADLTAQVSQEYVNREIASALTKKPVNILGVVDVKQVVVEFNPDSVLAADVRIAAFGRQLDFNIKDIVQVRGNQVALTLKEDPKLGGLGLPLGILNGVLDQVNVSVASQLNQLITSLGQAKDCTTGQQIGRVPTLLAINSQQGVLNAQFNIAITT